MAESAAPVARSLSKAVATGVLGEFTHEIAIADSDSFVIVYGPNGVGKTRFLEIIEAALSASVVRLISLPFKALTLTFTDGSVVSLARESVQDVPDENESARPSEEVLVFELLDADGNKTTSRLAAATDFEYWLSNSTPWELISDRIWRDASDGEVAVIDDLRRQYRARFNAESKRSPAREKLDPEIQAFLHATGVKLIGTERLTTVDDPGERALTIRYVREVKPPTPTVVSFSERIRGLLNDTLSSHSRLTQRLDSTFPRRMLERGAESLLNEEELRAKWDAQTTRRARLTQIADLGVDLDLSLPDAELNPWQLGMLGLYLEDAEAKLGSFSDVLARIDLLEALVNARLLRKRIAITATDGLVARRMDTDDAIPLVALSSGEQHEIILMFDLLFNVAPGSVVLIDEPEISLHIGWQKMFIADVLRVSKLVGFRFVVATHSPQIIDRWWGQAERLGPDDGGFHDRSGVVDA